MRALSLCSGYGGLAQGALGIYQAIANPTNPVLT